MIKKCLICKKLYNIKPCLIKTSKYCSWKCQHFSKIGKPNTSKTKFKVGHRTWNKGNHAYFGGGFRKGHAPWNLGKKHTKESREKMSKSLKGKIPWNKGKKYLQISKERHYAWKGGKIIQKGYWRILDKSHPNSDPNGYVKQSRIIMEKKIKRRLRPEEVVHHINHRKLDDRPENLMLLPNNSAHMHFHNKKIS